jgi:hypothetical protein
MAAGNCCAGAARARFLAIFGGLWISQAGQNHVPAVYRVSFFGVFDRFVGFERIFSGFRSYL